MRSNWLISIFLALAFCSSNAGAQDYVPLERKNDLRNSGSLKNERPAVMGGMKDAGTLPPVDFGRYSDTGFNEFDEAMKERDWGSEDTAWERARALDTKSAYEKYCAIYPNGPHRPDAVKKLIDIDVNNIFNGKHDDLPELKKISDEDTFDSTIFVHNETPYVLTVMYSGFDSKSIRIAPGGVEKVVLENGNYRIAASVPPPLIRPYAGGAFLNGGKYEQSYYIVSY